MADVRRASTGPVVRGFVLGPGGRARAAGGAGTTTVAMDLPCDDDAAGLAEYTDAVVDAIGDRRDDLVLVAQSLGGFTAPLVAERVPVAAHRARDGDGPAARRDRRRVVGQHRHTLRPWPRWASPTTARDAVHPRRARRTCWRPPGRLATSRATPMEEAVAARRLARRPHPLPALHGRPLLPARVDARRRPRPPRHRARRDPRRPLRLPQPAQAAGRRHPRAWSSDERPPSSLGSRADIALGAT